MHDGLVFTAPVETILSEQTFNISQSLVTWKGAKFMLVGLQYLLQFEFL